MSSSSYCLSHESTLNICTDIIVWVETQRKWSSAIESEVIEVTIVCEPLLCGVSTNICNIPSKLVVVIFISFINWWSAVTVLRQAKNKLLEVHLKSVTHQDGNTARDILLYFFWVICFVIVCDSGHQPERRSATENLRGQSSLPEHQHRLLGELVQTSVQWHGGRKDDKESLYWGQFSDFYLNTLSDFCCL